uniref:Uncharacterized protein n=1 Tax=Arundo donax TaxID=35708 RepID=A0A0A9FCJ4_ARUDO
MHMLWAVQTRGLERNLWILMILVLRLKA